MSSSHNRDTANVNSCRAEDKASFPERAANVTIQFWDEQRNIIRTRKGGWRIGKGVSCHGYSMMDELAGKKTYFQVVLLNVLGYLPSKNLCDWLEAFYVCMSWPDPRIWCNQIGALAGTARTTVVSATTAGTLAADSIMYGQYTLLAGAEFIQKALIMVKGGTTAEEVIRQEVSRSHGKVNIMGYARPLASGDERIPALERVTKDLGFSLGEHLKLAYQIEDIVQKEYCERMNINGYVSAFLSDQNLSPEQIYRINASLVASGVTACYVDARDRPPGSFLPLRCDDIAYEGKPARPVPPR